MSVLTLAGKPINWDKPPKDNALVKWSRTDQYGRAVIGTLRSIAHLDATDAKVVARWGVHLVVLQPSYNTGVAASAGTHDYDACFDVYIPGVSWAEQQKFFRVCGWGAYWRRPPKFGHHIHMFSIPVQVGAVRANDYRDAGIKVGKFVDGGWSTVGYKYTSAQLDAYYWHRDALASNEVDHSWFPPSIKATIFNLPAYAKARKTPPKPKKTIKPWFNVSFQNTEWNSVEGGKPENVKRTAPVLARASISGSPAICAFSEVRGSQRGVLDRAMAIHGYKRVAHDDGNMLIAYAKAQVEILGTSFAKFSRQDGGNVEGVLRIKFRVAGSRAQVGTLHLDWDSSEAKKRSNMRETYDAMKRYGQKTLVPDWKSRTVIIGDINHRTVAGEVLGPLGFKQMDTGNAPIDQAFVGKNRDDRGGFATKTPSNHKRILARLGRK